MEPRTLNNVIPFRAKRSKLFSGDQYNNNGSQCQERSEGRKFPIVDHGPTPRDSQTVKDCQMCNKKFIRMLRPKKECQGCGVIACGKCFVRSCKCLDSTGNGSRQSGFNPSVPLSLLVLNAYENGPRF